MKTNLLLTLSAMFVITSGISIAATMQAFGESNTTNNSNLTSSTEDQEVNDSQNDQIDPTLAAKAKVQPEQAKGTAVSNMSAQASDVRSVQLEDENGNLVYSVVILKDNKTFDVKVDAINGGVVRMDNGIDNEEDAEDQGPNEDKSFSGGLNITNPPATGGNTSQ